MPTVSFDEVKTKAILKACKAHGVSISAALFAVCNIAWARTQTKGWELPTYASPLDCASIPNLA